MRWVLLLSAALCFAADPADLVRGAEKDGHWQMAAHQSTRLGR